MTPSFPLEKQPMNGFAFFLAASVSATLAHMFYRLFG